MIILETNRLVLRHFQIFDTEAMIQIFGDAEVMRFSSGVKSPDWIRDWINTCLTLYYPTWGFGPWAVVTKADSKLIGYCGLHYFPAIDNQPEVELGYRLAKSAWGYGYATEAAAGVCNYAFNVLNLSRIVALIDPQNQPSIGVAQKAGFQYEKEVMLDGYDHPDQLYARDHRLPKP